MPPSMNGAPTMNTDYKTQPDLFETGSAVEVSTNINYEELSDSALLNMKTSGDVKAKEELDKRMAERAEEDKKDEMYNRGR